MLSAISRFPRSHIAILGPSTQSLVRPELRVEFQWTPEHKAVRATIALVPMTSSVVKE